MQIVQHFPLASKHDHISKMSESFAQPSRPLMMLKPLSVVDGWVGWCLSLSFSVVHYRSPHSSLWSEPRSRHPKLFMRKPSSRPAQTLRSDSHTTLDDGSE